MPEKGLLYVGMWDGSVFEMVMDTGELLQNTWYATGKAAHISVTQNRCTSGSHWI
jgi:hypothetical protein